MNNYKNIIRIVVAGLLTYYLLIPSIKILSVADEIYEVNLEEINSFNQTKALVISVDLIDSKKYPINYDKDSFKNTYRYELKNIETNTKDTLIEIIEKNTYFFQYLKPTYSVGDTIPYYKNKTKTITEASYDFAVKYKNNKPINWFAITLLTLSALGLLLLLKPVFKI